MANTTHYGLTCPDPTDNFSLEAWNGNMTKIDTAIQQASIQGGMKLLWSGAAMEIDGVTLPGEYFYDAGRCMMLLINGYMGISSGNNAQGVPNPTTSTYQSINFANTIGINLDVEFPFADSTYTGAYGGRAIRQDSFYVSSGANGGFIVTGLGEVSVNVSSASGVHTLSAVCNSCDSWRPLIITSIAAIRHSL